VSPCIEVAPGVTVCRSPYVRTCRWCVTCQRPRPMAGTYGLWYGAYLICLACGDSYSDEFCGTRHEVREPREFARNWKDKNLEAARRMWRNAAPLAQETARQHAEWMADLAAERAEEVPS
jgi:hypothetical protein